MHDCLAEDGNRRLTTRSSAPIDPDLEPLKARLEENGIMLTERQLSILAQRLVPVEDGRERSYAQIALDLSISEATVKREFNKIRQLLQDSTPSIGDTASKYSKSAETRARYRALLADPEKWSLTDRQVQYIGAYLELSEDGKPAPEGQLCAKLGLTNGQMHATRRRVNEIYPLGARTPEAA